MKLKSLLSWIALLIAETLVSQTFEWAKKINIYESCQENALFVGADSMGNSYMIGEGFCVVTGGNSYTYGTRLLKKYDPQGNMLWTDTIPKGGWKYAIDKSGNIFMTGGNYIKKISGLDGSSLWSKQIANRYFNQICVSNDGGVVVAGSVKYPGASCLDSSVYHKLDVYGNEKWNRIGDFYPLCGAYPIACDKNNVTYALGSLKQNNTYVTRLLQFDSTGNLIGLSELSEYTTAAKYFIDVTDKIYVASVTSYYPNYTNLLSCYNKKGGLLWSDMLNGKGLIYGLTHDNDNNIYLLPTIMGNLQYKDSNFVYTWGTGVIKLDPDGEYIWTKFVSDNEMIGAVSMHVDESKNIFLAGKGEGTTQFDNHTLVTDPEYGDLFIAKLSPPAPVVGINEKQKAESKWQVYPNPTTGHLHISSNEYAGGKTEIKISNVIGQCIFSKSCSSSSSELSEQIDLSKYSKGIYLVEINSEKGKEVKKVILE